ncbi:hypothetical protein DLE01_01535, partial [Streptomyces sp. FT05W]
MKQSAVRTLGVAALGAAFAAAGAGSASAVAVPVDSLAGALRTDTAMPRPTAAQYSYGSATVVFSALAMLLLFRTES